MHVFPRISQKTAKDLADYWDHNWDLAQELQTYWGDSGPASMDSVFPVRLYGDGADTIGLNAFELLTMISVAPQHSQTWKTRFVFLGFVLTTGSTNVFPDQVTKKNRTNVSFWKPAQAVMSKYAIHC